jgi:Zn-dependent metalloprotease
MICTRIACIWLAVAGLGMALPATAAPSTHVTLHALGHVDNAAIAKRLGLGAHAALVPAANSLKTIHGTHINRAQQTWRGIPVYGCGVAIERDDAGNVLSVEGNIARGLPDALASTRPALQPDAAVAALRKQLGLSKDNQQINHVQHKLYIDPRGNAPHLVYKVSFFTSRGIHPKRPTALVDAQTGRILQTWHGLTTQSMTHKVTPGGATTHMQLQHAPSTHKPGGS